MKSRTAVLQKPEYCKKKMEHGNYSTVEIPSVRRAVSGNNQSACNRGVSTILVSWQELDKMEDKKWWYFREGEVCRWFLTSNKRTTENTPTPFHITMLHPNSPLSTLAPLANMCPFHPNQRSSISTSVLQPCIP